MSLAVALALVQVAAILIMLTGLFVRKLRNAMLVSRSRRLAPLVQEAVALHAIGIDQRARLEELRKQAPQDVRETLFSMLASMRGDAREGVARLAADLGFVKLGEDIVDWIRNLILVRHGEAFEEIVRAVAHQNLLVRAVAAEELAPYAANIDESQIVRVFESADADVVIAALDMLRAWRRALHVPGYLPLIAHNDARIRARALLALQYVAAAAQPDVIGPSIVCALSHESPDVRAAAATAAGRLGVGRAVQALGSRLTDSERQVALAAAFALVALGESGNILLERAVMSPDRAAGSVAFEALEKAALGLAEVS
jgi:HEAT repeat protein